MVVVLRWVLIFSNDVIYLVYGNCFRVLLLNYFPPHVIWIWTSPSLVQDFIIKFDVGCWSIYTLWNGHNLALHCFPCQNRESITFSFVHILVLFSALWWPVMLKWNLECFYNKPILTVSIHSHWSFETDRNKSDCENKTWICVRYEYMFHPYTIERLFLNFLKFLK
jgi:hypothetical protein